MRYGGATDEVRVSARREHVQALQGWRASVHRRGAKTPECAKVSRSLLHVLPRLRRAHKRATAGGAALSSFRCDPARVPSVVLHWSWSRARMMMMMMMAKTKMTAAGTSSSSSSETGTGTDSDSDGFVHVGSEDDLADALADWTVVLARDSKREYLLAQIRQKNAIIESLLKQVRIPAPGRPPSSPR